MNNARYQQIRIFQTIASEGSITAAARKLELTAPSVSKALKNLEQHIGLPLFLRSTRRIELTEAGRRLLARSSDAVQALQDAIESVRDDNATPSGLVRVTLSRFAYQLIFRPHLAEIAARYPQLQLELSLYDGTINILEHGYDLGIRFGDTLEDGMVARQLLPPLTEGLYASPEYLTRHGTPQTPADLAQHRLIGYRYITANRILPLLLDDHGDTLSVEMATPFISNGIDALADAIRAGIGIGRLFTRICAQQANRDRFRPVLRDYWRTYPGVYLYHLPQAQKARRVRVLIDFLLEKAAAMLGEATPQNVL